MDSRTKDLTVAKLRELGIGEARSQAIMLANGETLSIKDMSDFNLVKRNLQAIKSNCNQVLKQMDQISV